MRYEILDNNGAVINTVIADEEFMKDNYSSYRLAIEEPPPPPRPPLNGEQQAMRKQAYEREADPIFFMAQRGEATTEEWQAKVAEIKERYPYYYDDEGNLLEAK